MGNWGGDESAGPELSADTEKNKNGTYVFLSVEHEAAIELGELTEGHVSIPQLRVLQKQAVTPQGWAQRLLTPNNKSTALEQHHREKKGEVGREMGEDRSLW